MKNFLDIKKYKGIIIKVILSFFSTVGIICTYQMYLKDVYLTNSFVNMIIFLLYVFIYSNIKKLSKKENILSVIFSILLSAIVIIGTQLEVYTDMSWGFKTVFKIFSLTFSIYPFLNFIINYINKKNFVDFDNYDKKKLFIMTFLIIFVFDFLVFLAVYPGLYAYDAGMQSMIILRDEVPLTSHFSLVYSAFFAYIIQFGKNVFGSYQIGFAIYALIQLLFMDFVATKITIYSVDKIKNKVFYIFCLVLFSLCPLYTIMVVSAAQDVLFAGMFALIVISLLRLIEDKNYYKNIYNPIILSVLILLMCLIRNNGFYAVLVAIPFLIIFNKNKKIITLIVILIPLLLYKVYSGPIQDKMGVIKYDTMNEMLSIPSQQLARVYNYNKKVFSKSDLKSLNAYYTNLDSFKYYKINQLIADYAKSSVNNDVVSNDLFGYIKFWGKIGLKDPKNYTEAFLLNSLGFWFPNKEYHDYRMYHPYIEYTMMDAKIYNKDYIDIKRTSLFKPYEKLLNVTLTLNAWKRVPVISTLFTTGTYFVTYLFLIGLTIIRKKYNYLAPIGFVLGLYCTLFLSPVCLFRYCFPIFMIIPIIMALILNNYKDKTIKKQR